MRVWYSPAGHVLGALSSRLGVVVGSDAGGSAGVTGGMGAIACLCCPRMSWHSKNAAVTAPVMAVWASSVMCISSSPNVIRLLNFWHHASTASLSLNMRANCDGCLTPMWRRYNAILWSLGMPASSKICSRVLATGPCIVSRRSEWENRKCLIYEYCKLMKMSLLMVHGIYVILCRPHVPVTDLILENG